MRIKIYISAFLALMAFTASAQRHRVVNIGRPSIYTGGTFTTGTTNELLETPLGDWSFRFRSPSIGQYFYGVSDTADLEFIGLRWSTLSGISEIGRDLTGFKVYAGTNLRLGSNNPLGRLYFDANRDAANQNEFTLSVNPITREVEEVSLRQPKYNTIYLSNDGEDATGTRGVINYPFASIDTVMSERTTENIYIEGYHEYNTGTTGDLFLTGTGHLRQNSTTPLVTTSSGQSLTIIGDDLILSALQTNTAANMIDIGAGTQDVNIKVKSINNVNNPLSNYLRYIFNPDPQVSSVNLDVDSLNIFGGGLTFLAGNNRRYNIDIGVATFPNVATGAFFAESMFTLRKNANANLEPCFVDLNIGQFNRQHFSGDKGMYAIVGTDNTSHIMDSLYWVSNVDKINTLDSIGSDTEGGSAQIRGRFRNSTLTFNVGEIKGYGKHVFYGRSNMYFEDTDFNFNFGKVDSKYKIVAPRISTIRLTRSNVNINCIDCIITNNNAISFDFVNTAASTDYKLTVSGNYSTTGNNPIITTPVPIYLENFRGIVENDTIPIVTATNAVNVYIQGSFYTNSKRTDPNVTYVFLDKSPIAGTDTLVAGTVTVNNNYVNPNSVILVSVNTPGGAVGELSAPSSSIVAGTSFVINSSNAGDTSTVNWYIINP